MENKKRGRVKGERLARIELPEKLVKLFQGKARYRVAYGGRGSGKTRSFALMAAIRAFQLSENGKRGVIVCAREYMNSINNSMQAEVISAIKSRDWLEECFDISERQIKTKNGLISFRFVGLNRNLSSIKSMANIHLCWVDEAENVSEQAWIDMIPTVREKDSEIWVTWNPASKHSAVHKRFRENTEYSELLKMKIVEINWRDNPWFPDVLNQERLNDLKMRPHHYHHIWEGDFIQSYNGSYYSNELRLVREEGRVTQLFADPLLKIRTYWDIGGAGAKADATAIWVVQFVGEQIKVLDYYEAQGQPLAAHVNWLRSKGYSNAEIVLPHDGKITDRVHNVSFESALMDAGFNVEVVPNQGAGAARGRIEAARQVFPRIWFNEETTRAGIDALAWYHEKRDQVRDIGLGPEHDWSSHAADAFGLMCLHVLPIRNNQIGRRRYQDKISGSWMSA